VAVEGMGTAGQGIAFLVSAGIVAEIVAKACSSPQTTELNADKRAPTLMKWVTIGLVEAAAFVILAAAIDKKHAGAIIAGGAMEGVITLMEYQHGKAAGLAATSQPGTEQY
jgi:hypothetical protein